MRAGAPVLLVGKGKKYFVKAGDHDLHTDVGVFKPIQLLDLDYGDSIFSHLGFELRVRQPRLPDFFNVLKRTGAPISPKDAGMIISHTGLGKDDAVLDAGTGSGIMAIYLGCVAKRVVSCEAREDFVQVAKENIELVGLDNVVVQSRDIMDAIPELDETFNVVTLDMHRSSDVVPLVPDILCPGGYLVVFTPFIEQAKAVRWAISDTGFEDVVTLECTQREITFSERGTRPSTIRVGYTGLVTFARVP